VLSEREKLDQIVHLSTELAEISDVDILLGHILACARRFVNADAGSIYVADNDALEFCCTQNDTLQGALPPGQKLAFTSFFVHHPKSFERSISVFRLVI